MTTIDLDGNVLVHSYKLATDVKVGDTILFADLLDEVVDIEQMGPSIKFKVARTFLDGLNGRTQRVGTFFYAGRKSQQCVVVPSVDPA